MAEFGLVLFTFLVLLTFGAAHTDDEERTVSVGGDNFIEPER